MGKQVQFDYFSNPNKFYRIVRGEESIKDIQKSGSVRSASTAGVKYEPSTGSIDLANRPTKWPSFSKGKASIEYAKSSPEHYIIETKTKLSQSKTGRHGKGSTYFPPIDPKTKQPSTTIPAAQVKIWKHVGDGKYQPVSNQPNLKTPTPTGIGFGLLGAGLVSAEQALKEGKSVYKLFGGGWDYANGRSPEASAEIQRNWDKLQKENPSYYDELTRLSRSKTIPTNSIQYTSDSYRNLPYQINNLLKLK